MLNAVDRAGRRNVSPEEVVAGGDRQWELSCPRCQRDVHLVRAVTPHFAHEAGVPSTACVLRNDHPSGDAELPRRRVGGFSPERSGRFDPVEPRLWECPICGWEADGTIAGRAGVAPCDSCLEDICGDGCRTTCERCGKNICDHCMPEHAAAHLTPPVTR